NRFMSEKVVYFFKPRDFTQMILRAPQKMMVGKVGNFETWAIEMEVGLRLRDRFAAGVLVVDKS
ncbi:MAG: SU10 major capsid protein, partial [Cetobacterium sp.]|uniref:SU10 major capsid protein n=1 Tax=Cetobacterium sp. TaxID=2071632 RepID=UPI003EE5395B